MWHCCRHRLPFVAVMFSAAQPSIARALIYLVLGSVAHRVHGLRRDHPPPQPPDETAGAGGV